MGKKLERDRKDELSELMRSIVKNTDKNVRPKENSFYEIVSPEERYRVPGTGKEAKRSDWS